MQENKTVTIFFKFELDKIFIIFFCIYKYLEKKIICFNYNKMALF